MINGNKVNVNILKNEEVFIFEEDDISLIVIYVPRSDYKFRPVYVGENPYKGMKESPMMEFGKTIFLIFLQKFHRN